MGHGATLSSRMATVFVSRGSAWLDAIWRRVEDTARAVRVEDRGGGATIILFGGLFVYNNSRRKIGELTDKGNKVKPVGKMTCKREEKLQMKVFGRLQICVNMEVKVALALLVLFARVVCLVRIDPCKAQLAYISRAMRPMEGAAGRLNLAWRVG